MATPSDLLNADLNLATLDGVVTSNAVSVNDRLGQQKLTYAEIQRRGLAAIDQIESDGLAAIESTGWFIVGEFSTGFTFTARNQVGRDSTGEFWSYNGATLPFVVSAGTVPSEPTYTNRGDAALRSALSAGTADIDGQPASTISYDVLKYGAIKELPTAGETNAVAFRDAFLSSSYVTFRDGVFYVSDTVDVRGYTQFDIPGCTIVTTGMAGKPLFRFPLENATTASGLISINMGGGSIAGDAAYAFEFVGVDTAPSSQESCRIIKISGVTVSAASMRFAKCVNAAKSLFFNQIWHYGGSFLDTNGKVVELQISNSLIFSSGADPDGFLLESNGGTNQYSEGLLLSNCTVDGYENCFNIRDLFVITLVSSYVGGSKAFLFRPPVTTHNREFNIGPACVFAGRIVFADGVGGIIGNGKISGAIFAGAAAPVIEVGNGWSRIDIENIKAESNSGSATVAVLVKNGCNDINVSGVNADFTFNGAVEFTGMTGENCRVLNANSTVGRSVAAARPVIVRNPSFTFFGDSDLRGYTAKIPVVNNAPAGAVFGSVGASLAKGQVGTIRIGGLVFSSAGFNSLVIDGVSDLQIPDGVGWSGAVKQIVAGDSTVEWSLDFVAKVDLPFVEIRLINGAEITSQQGSHAYISVIKEL